uniref:(northern house mosquito) hypothetical protein n=1 Tax=Culex pipiens TaxID=7175 RepID=A0A8D8B3E4_CULPI
MAGGHFGTTLEQRRFCPIRAFCRPPPASSQSRGSTRSTPEITRAPRPTRNRPASPCTCCRVKSQPRCSTPTEVRAAAASVATRTRQRIRPPKRRPRAVVPRWWPRPRHCASCYC